jgi:formamidopyrimidine-DNA glycosylase
VPELPEVERYRRFFSRHVVGKTVLRVDVTDVGILRVVTAPELDRALRGRRFEEPDRLGKWLIAWTDGPALLLHFGMTGDLAWGADERDRHRHDRVIVVVNDGELRYRNLRKIGGVWLAHHPDEVAAILGPLGPDALSVGRREFLDRLSRRRGQIKPALLSQRLVAGVGNLMADEILWQAPLHPARRIETLSDTDRDRLFDVLRAVLRQAIRRGDAGGEHRSLLAVRGEPGAACPRCGTVLERSVIGGRTTYHCPGCQPLVH